MTKRYAQSPADLMPRDEFLAIGGLEMLQRMIDGRAPGPAMAQTMNLSLTTAEEGRVVFEGHPDFAHTNPAGTTHGGWFGTMLDTAMACAVMSLLPAGSTYSTLEFRVNLIRALPPGTRVRGIGTADHVGRSTGVAHGQIRGTVNDRLYATGSTTCLIVRP